MTTDAARAFWVTGRGRAEIRDENLAAPGPDEALVRTVATGISRGTEALVFNGRVPRSQYADMRAPFQAGDFPAPVKYGYANVGVVETGPPDLVGQTVFCLYPHQTAYVVPTAKVVPVPADVPPARAVLAANMETAVNGLWDAAPRIGDRVAVVGAGVVGCLIACLVARMPGTAVQLIDIDPGKADVAAALGAPFADPDNAVGACDLVIHASGHPDGLVAALGLAGFEATVLEMSWFGSQPVSLPLGESFHAKRLRLQSSQVGAVAATRRARWSRTQRLELALSLLTDDRLDALITGESDFVDLPRTMAALAKEPAGTLCHRIRYQQPQ